MSPFSLFRLPLLALVAVLLFTAPQHASANDPRVVVKTSMGELVIELYPAKAPKSVENFLKYVAAGHYTGTIFHRVIGNFMIQGGGFTRDFYKSQFQPKPTQKPIDLESQNGLKNDAGWVAMARTARPDSATSQFYINTVDNPSLNYPAPDGHGHTVFGKVVKGMDIVNKIRAVQTHALGPFSDVPFEPVVIDSIALIGNSK
jgi:peptidyl-prolyl cis-trans isomerase A (cyclophilin A)